jgi:hypothetical protein
MSPAPSTCYSGSTELRERLSPSELREGLLSACLALGEFPEDSLEESLCAYSELTEGLRISCDALSRITRVFAIRGWHAELVRLPFRERLAAYILNAMLCTAACSGGDRRATLISLRVNGIRRLLHPAIGDVHLKAQSARYRLARRINSYVGSRILAKLQLKGFQLLTYSMGRNLILAPTHRVQHLDQFLNEFAYHLFGPYEGFGLEAQRKNLFARDLYGPSVVSAYQQVNKAGLRRDQGRATYSKGNSDLECARMAKLLDHLEDASDGDIKVADLRGEFHNADHGNPASITRDAGSLPSRAVERRVKPPDNEFCRPQRGVWRGDVSGFLETVSEGASDLGSLLRANLERFRFFYRLKESKLFESSLHCLHCLADDIILEGTDIHRPALEALSDRYERRFGGRLHFGSAFGTHASDFTTLAREAMDDLIERKKARDISWPVNRPEARNN